MSTESIPGAIADRRGMELTVPLTLVLGYVIPPCIGSLWGDAMGSFVWAALVARLLGTHPLHAHFPLYD